MATKSELRSMETAETTAKPSTLDRVVFAAAITGIVVVVLHLLGINWSTMGWYAVHLPLSWLKGAIAVGSHWELLAVSACMAAVGWALGCGERWRRRMTGSVALAMTVTVVILLVGGLIKGVVVFGVDHERWRHDRGCGLVERTDSGFEWKCPGDDQ